MRKSGENSFTVTDQPVGYLAGPGQIRNNLLKLGWTSMSESGAQEISTMSVLAGTF